MVVGMSVSKVQDLINSYPPGLQSYVKGAFRNIGGACDARVFFTLRHMLEIQGADRPKKVAEIGVRDGRFFIGIMKCLSQGSSGLAIDLFEDQQHNIDGSGWRPPSHGVPFHRNVEETLGDKYTVKFRKGDSLNLSISDVVDISYGHGPFDIFSIDGGHEAEHLTNDLTIAELTIHHSGLVLLDDYYNPNFPGVHEGFSAYMTQKRKMVPIAFSAGKLYLCTKSYYGRYNKALRSSFTEINAVADYAKWTRMFGYDVLHVAV